MTNKDFIHVVTEDYGWDKTAEDNVIIYWKEDKIEFYSLEFHGEDVVDGLTISEQSILDDSKYPIFNGRLIYKYSSAILREFSFLCAQLFFK